MPIQWPTGASVQLARKRKLERATAEEPPTRRLRQGKPERARKTESTIGSASATAEPVAAVVPQKSLKPHVRWALGPGHDLRLSGDLVWCRDCGRFGAERIKTGVGIGGPCLGKEGRAHTQLKLLKDGKHPRTQVPIPPDVAFLR